MSAGNIASMVAVAMFVAGVGGWIARAEGAHENSEKAAAEAKQERNELRAATRVLQDAELVRARASGHAPPQQPSLPQGFHYCDAPGGTVTICSDATGRRLE